MEKAWEKAIEMARGGQNPSETLSLTLDGAMKCAACRLPAASLLEPFSRLQHLSIANAGLISLEGFPSLPLLKRLVLSDNRISGGLEYLVQAGLKSLQDLDLSNNRIQAYEDLVPLSQFNIVSLDLYECPVTRLPDYRARVFDIIKSLQFLDKTDREGKERFDSEEEGEEVDSEDEEEEDVDNFNSEERPNGTRFVSPEDLEEDDEDDELDVEEEEEYQDGVTINGHVSAVTGHVAANATTGNSSDDDDVEDEDDYQNAEVQDVDEEDESDEVAEDDGEEDAGVAEDEEDEGTEQASGTPGELDVQDNDQNDDNGEVGDEDDDEGVDNDNGEDDGEDEEEDYGTEYLVQPIGKPEDEDGGSDFEPAENDPEEEDIDEDEDDANQIVGSHKRRRDEVDTDSDDDEDKNPKRR